MGKEAEKGAEVYEEDAQPFQAALDRTFLPLRGPVRKRLPGSHPLSLEFPISVENRVLPHAYVESPWPLTQRACEQSVPVLPQPEKQSWVLLSHVDG